jgi:hypothetical protein
MSTEIDRLSIPGAVATLACRRHFCLLVSLSLGLAIILGIAAQSAFGCGEPNGDHCYGITQWNMNKSLGEEVYGAQAEISVGYGSVPNWSSEDGFLDDEMWVDFPGERWEEGGLSVGYPFGEKTLYYFVAREYGSNKYWEYEYPGSTAPWYEWIGLYIDEPYGANGDWCYTWAWDSKPDFCWSGFPASSTELQAGLEFATTTASGADNNGQLVGWAYWTNDTWHELWAGSYNHAYRVTPNKPICTTVPSPGYTWGSIAFAIPGC